MINFLGLQAHYPCVGPKGLEFVPGLKLGGAVKINLRGGFVIPYKNRLVQTNCFSTLPNCLYNRIRLSFLLMAFSSLAKYYLQHNTHNPCGVEIK
jgi:hypothetical protein